MYTRRREIAGPAESEHAQVTYRSALDHKIPQPPSDVDTFLQDRLGGLCVIQEEIR
jgi:hypothetical protein